MKHKYNARKVEYEGIMFDSTTERNRYIELQRMQSIGEIFDLELQPRFEVIPKLVISKTKQLKTKTKTIFVVDERAAYYTADFAYYNNKGVYVIEEVKSKATMMARDYSLRRKLIKQLIKRHNENLTGCIWEFKEIVIR